MNISHVGFSTFIADPDSLVPSHPSTPDDLTGLARLFQETVATDPLKTPPHTPRAPTSFMTPSPVRNIVAGVKDFTPDRSFLEEERDTVGGHVDKLIEITTDTPMRRERATSLNKAMERVATSTFSKTGKIITGVPEEEKKKPVRKCLGLFDFDMDETWPNEMLGDLHNELQQCAYPSEDPTVVLVNLKHLLTPELQGKKAVGFHFLCKKNEKFHHLVKERATNPFTDVWCGEYTLPGSNGPKTSTFFPRSIKKLKTLVTYLNRGEVLAKQGNREILRIPGQPFIIEVYLRTNLKIWSFFPLFYFAPYQKDVPYAITKDLVLNSQEVLQYVKAAVLFGHVKYKLDKDDIVDIAPVIAGCPVPSGIYIQIPR